MSKLVQWLKAAWKWFAGASRAGGCPGEGTPASGSAQSNADSPGQAVSGDGPVSPGTGAGSQEWLDCVADRARQMHADADQMWADAIEAHREACGLEPFPDSAMKPWLVPPMPGVIRPGPVGWWSSPAEIEDRGRRAWKAALESTEPDGSFVADGERWYPLGGKQRPTPAQA
jgi:hypothetical protein